MKQPINTDLWLESLRTNKRRHGYLSNRRARRLFVLLLLVLAAVLAAAWHYREVWLPM